MTNDEIIQAIEFGSETAIGLESIKERLDSGKKLRVKLGVDPTRPDLTLGHAVVFKKLRQLQDMGHQAILLIGDYTAMIGDPSGRSATRPALTEEEVAENSKTYLDQAFKILDKDKTEVRRNSEWFAKMSFADSLNLSRKMTVARMLERDDFSKRFASNSPISIVEFLYPLVQGHDSVVLESDLELGGHDQLFNLLVGRALQKDAGQPEQAVVCMPLLVGTDGVRKMSKSYDNYISFNDSPKDMFGKLMSLSDETMWEYYKLVLNTHEDEIERLRQGHPMESKKNLAVNIVTAFYSEKEGLQEREAFESVFSKGNIPEDMPEFGFGELAESSQAATLLDLMSATKLFPSKKEVRRLITQGAVKVNDEKQADPFYELKVPAGDPYVIQSGKRTFFKVKA